MKGQAVCRAHGGATPGAIEAAADRLQQTQAEAAVSRLLLGGKATTPVTDPVEALQRLSGVLDSAVARVTAETSLDEMDGPRARFLTVLVRELRQALADMARLGIEERIVRLAEQEADLLEAGLRWWLQALGLAADERAGRLLHVLVVALSEGRVPTESDVAALEAGAA